MLIFLSASLGLLARSDIQFKRVAIKQFVYAGIGIFLLILVANIHWSFWKKMAVPLFLLSLILTLLVFTPLGLTLKGARRWLEIGPLSFQPAEFLKFGYILYLSAWLAEKKNMHRKNIFIPFIFTLGVIGAILLT